jgi:hypothetical protein
MEVIQLSRFDFDTLRLFKTDRRPNWHAVFSTNCHEDVFGLVREGYCPPEERHEVRGASRLADVISDALLRVRPEGGRIFVDERGAFYKNKFSHLEQFVKFQFMS